VTGNSFEMPSRVGLVRGSPLNSDNGTCNLFYEYISQSYSQSSHVICITPFHDVVSKPVLCPLAGIHENCVSIG